MGSYQQSDDEEEPVKKKSKMDLITDEDSVSYPVPDNTNNWPIDVSIPINFIIF